MKKLYEDHSYQKKNRTVITSCVPEGDRYRITLEESIFFPEEGGQYADTGSLTVLRDEDQPAKESVTAGVRDEDQPAKESVTAGVRDGERPAEESVTVRILDGQIQKGEICYLTDGEIPAGTPVECTLDWEPRYMRMQQHTGEHILTGVIHRRFGYNNVGFHLSDDAPVTLDLDGTLTSQGLTEVELEANEMIYANLPVMASYPSKEELAAIDYRSKIEIEGQVRLITIGEESDPVDICACCAPHVARTGEVGLIKILTAQNYKGGIRLHILCGKRALQYCQEQNAILNQLARTFSTSMDKVIPCVESALSEITELKYRNAELKQAELEHQIQALPQGANACLFADGDISGVTAKNCYNALAERYDGYVGLFMGDDVHGYRFQAGSRLLDSRELMRRMTEELNARGGGSERMAQGKSAAKREQIEAFFSSLYD